MANFKIFRTSSGQSAIELGLTLPAIIFLLFGIFEWGQIFVRHIRASTICREAVLVANRECKNIQAGQGAEESVEARTRACLNQVRRDMFDRASQVLPDFEESGDILIRFYGAVETQSQSKPDTVSRINGGTDADLQAMLGQLGIIGVSELFYDNQLLTPAAIFFDMIMPRLIYKSAVA